MPPVHLQPPHAKHRPQQPPAPNDDISRYPTEQPRTGAITFLILLRNTRPCFSPQIWTPLATTISLHAVCLGRHAELKFLWAALSTAALQLAASRVATTQVSLSRRLLSRLCPISRLTKQQHRSRLMCSASRLRELTNWVCLHFSRPLRSLPVLDAGHHRLPFRDQPWIRTFSVP